MYLKKKLIKIDKNFSLKFDTSKIDNKRFIFKSLILCNTEINNFFTANNLISCFVSFTKSQLNIQEIYQIDNLIFSVVQKNKIFYLKVRFVDELEDDLFFDKFEANCLINNLNKFFNKFEPILTCCEV